MQLISIKFSCLLPIIGCSTFLCKRPLSRIAHLYRNFFKVKIRCTFSVFIIQTFKKNQTCKVRCNTLYFWKTLIEVGSSHIYASFGTFCVQIGQLFEVQRVFEKCMKTVKSLFSKENDVDFEFFRKFKVSPIWTQKVPKEA